MRLALVLALAPVLALAACRPEASVEAPADASALPPPSAEASPEPARPDAAPGPDPWEAARARGALFRAVGQEPGWFMEVYADSVRVVADYGERRGAFPAPVALPEGEAFRFEARGDGRTLGVEVRATPCADAMSGAPYPSTVTLTLDGQTYTGCGRRLG